MPIVATCPYCRAGGVRAPDHAAGATATCPKCKSSYTIVPDAGLPGWNSPAPQAPLDETKPQVAVADVTEPSPVLPTKPTPAAPKPRREIEAVPTPPGLASALVALTCFGLSVAATQFPYGRYSGPGLAALGLLVSLFSVAAENRARWIGAAAMVLNGAIIALVFLAASWVGLEPWRKPVPPGGERGPQTLAHGTGAAAPAEWVDAASGSWAYGDLRITVVSAAVNTIELSGPNGAKRMSKDPCLVVTVRVANDGVERRIDLRGWAAGGDGAELTDPAGNVLKVKRFDGGWEPASRATAGVGLFPGKTATVPLTFEAPVTKPEYLRLKLSGEAFAIPEPIRFKLPSQFVQYPNVKPR
jgi:hypothetical protein